MDIIGSAKRYSVLGGLLSDVQAHWRLSQVPDEALKAVQAALTASGIRAPHDVAFVASVLEDAGLFWNPWPPPGMTARELMAEAKRITRRLKGEGWQGPPTTKPGATALMESGVYQTVRGGRVIPVRPHGRRRPEPEVIWAVRLIDRHLREVSQMTAKSRRECIAGVLGVLDGLSMEALDRELTKGTTAREVKAEAVRKRLERTKKPLQDYSYEYARWRAESRDNPNARFPHPQTFPVILIQRPDGSVTWDWQVRPWGVSLEEVTPYIERAVQARVATGRPVELEEAIMVYVPGPG